uniref:microfibril-associated glycoprotein 4-like n=1 Tax=Solea senegalensis TaxID=28829 RepID=UPI001CD82CE4|nr:microfibril-associated glycoprotein 4-like [Solea senegalensis]
MSEDLGDVCYKERLLPSVRGRYRDRDEGKGGTHQPDLDPEHALSVASKDSDIVLTKRNEMVREGGGGKDEGFILFLALIPAAICASVSRPGDCTDVYNGGSEDSGVYTIYTLGPVQVYCNIGCEEESVRWTVIQRRKDGNVNFLRGWDQYRSGFGEPSGGFWLRLENIHLLTQRKSYELKVVMEDFEGNKAYVYYSTFSVGPEEDGYRLQVSGFRNGRRGPAAGKRYRNIKAKNNRLRDSFFPRAVKAIAPPQ